MRSTLCGRRESSRGDPMTSNYYGTLLIIAHLDNKKGETVKVHPRRRRGKASELPRERVRLRWALWLKERAAGWVNNVREREGECQVDIVDGDNAAEIAGGQRGLMMMLLASERASERANRASCSWTGTHHCILRFTLCHQSTAPHGSTPRSFLRHFPLPLFSSRAIALPHYSSFSNSDIARDVDRCRGIWCSRISYHRPLTP